MAQPYRRAYVRASGRLAMADPDPAMFKLCLRAAAAALHEAIVQLQGAAMYAADRSEREAVLAPIGGLDLARQHVEMICPNEH